MRIGDPDSKTTLPPRGLDPDPSSMLCCVTVREQCNVRSLRAVWSSRATTLNLDRGSISVNPFSVPVWRASIFQGGSKFAAFCSKAFFFTPQVGNIFFSLNGGCFFFFLISMYPLGIKWRTFNSEKVWMMDA